MSPLSESSISAFKYVSTVISAAVAGALILALAAPASGQDSAVKPSRTPKRVHWRKYVNKEFGLSFRYPQTYRPSNSEGKCWNDVYRKCLVYLERRGNPDASILVTIIVKSPFVQEAGAGGLELTRQRIGDYFYCGLGGSMGTCFTDECIFNLRDRTLEFSFTPDNHINNGWKTNSLTSKVLKTFRTL